MKNYLGLLTVLDSHEGNRVLYKVLCCCNATKLATLAANINIERRPFSLERVRELAVRLEVGCSCCLTVFDREKWLTNLPPAMTGVFRETFDLPMFNPLQIDDGRPSFRLFMVAPQPTQEEEGEIEDD